MAGSRETCSGSEQARAAGRTTSGRSTGMLLGEQLTILGLILGAKQLSDGGEDSNCLDASGH